MLKLRAILANSNNATAATLLNLSSQRNASSGSNKLAFNKDVTVVGSGLMGSGIAQVTAEAGYQVNLVDQSDKILDKALAAIRTSLQRSSKKRFAKEADAEKLVEKHVSEVLSRIKPSTSAEQSAQTSDLIIEAIVENMSVKHELFKKLDKAAPASTFFASNTSSLPIGEIAQVTQRRDKFGGLHFFNPVPMMKLLEIIRANETSDATHKTFIEYGKSIGKVTVDCKDTPGFIVNRLLVPYMLEAVRLVERGEATPQDTDIAMKLGAGYPMGPFELLDYVGLDTSKFIIDGWHAKYPDEPLFKPSKTLDKLISEGKFGRKSGEGFYKYQKK